MLVISTYTTLSATEDPPVRTEAVGLEHLDREENRIGQDSVKLPGMCLLQLGFPALFPASPLKKKEKGFFVQVWRKQGNFQAAPCIFPASCGLFPRKAALLSAGKARCDLQWCFVGVVLLGRERWGAGLGSPGGAEQGSLFGTSPVPTWPSRTVLPLFQPKFQPSITLKGTEIYGNCLSFWCRGYKFGLGSRSDKACDYGSALFTGSCYLLFVCWGCWWN